MPHVGCGLDQLDWQNVKDKINDVFHGWTVQLTVLTLQAVTEQTNAEVSLTPDTPVSAEKTHFDEFSSALQNGQQKITHTTSIISW